MLKDAVLKKNSDELYDMNKKRKSFNLLQTFDQIQQNNLDVREGINKSVAICKEENVFLDPAL